MKKIIMLLLAVFACVSFTNAQSNDVSVWIKTNDQDKKINSFVWGTYAGKDVFLDYRWNFDVDNALGAFVGKTIGFSSKRKTSELFLTPEIGIIYSHKQYIGVSPELLAAGHIGPVVFFSFSQYSKGLNNQSGDFAYQYNELGYQFKGGEKLGVTADMYYDVPSRTHTEKVGLYALMPIGSSFYVKAQGNTTTDGKVTTIMAAIGYMF